MPISKEKGLIHIRIPNESDAAVNSLLADFEDQQPHGVSYYLDNYQSAFSKTKKFCVIRSPWDRVTYFFEQIKAHEDAPDHELIKDKSFEEFLEDFEKNRDSYKNICWLPQTAWIWSDYGPIVNHVFVEDPEYLENPQLTTLKTQFEMLLKLELEIPEIDREEALRRRKDYLSDDVVERIAKLYKHDVESFSYVYDPSDDDALHLSTEPPSE